MGKASKAMWYKEVPDNQRFSYTVTPLPGSLMRAKMLGGQLKALSKLMTALGDQDGYDMETFLADISMGGGGTVKFDLVVLPKLPNDAIDDKEQP